VSLEHGGETMSPRIATEHTTLSDPFSASLRTVSAVYHDVHRSVSGRELLAALQAGYGKRAATLLVNGAPVAAIDEFGPSADVRAHRDSNA
jgi:hypothetical protein